MAWSGGGASGSAKYGVAFIGGDPAPTLTLPAGFMPVSMQVTNTTYAGIVIQNGNAFSRKFGDNPATPGIVETNHPDYFKLTIRGSDAAGQPVGSPIEVYLADYRFANDAQDFVFARMAAREFVGASRRGQADIRSGNDRRGSVRGEYTVLLCAR